MRNGHGRVSHRRCLRALGWSPCIPLITSLAFVVPVDRDLARGLLWGDSVDPNFDVSRQVWRRFLERHSEWRKRRDKTGKALLKQSRRDRGGSRELGWVSETHATVCKHPPLMPTTNTGYKVGRSQCKFSDGSHLPNADEGLAKAERCGRRFRWT